MINKVCRVCGIEKPLTEYATYTAKANGKRYYRHQCKDCRSQRYRTYYKDNRESCRKKAKSFYDRNVEAQRLRARKTHRNKTKEIYDELFDKQQGLCAICGEPEKAVRNGRVKDLALDHCHTSGKYRGLLCQCCNTALGRVKDNVNILENMIRYLNDKSSTDNR